MPEKPSGEMPKPLETGAPSETETLPTLVPLDEISPPDELLKLEQTVAAKNFRRLFLSTENAFIDLYSDGKTVYGSYTEEGITTGKDVEIERNKAISQIERGIRFGEEQVKYLETENKEEIKRMEKDGGLENLEKANKVLGDIEGWFIQRHIRPIIQQRIREHKRALDKLLIEKSRLERLKRALVAISPKETK